MNDYYKLRGIMRVSYNIFCLIKIERSNIPSNILNI